MNKRCGLLSVTKRNGLIIQWGFDSASGTSKTSKQFPISFTSMWIGGASNRQGWATGNIGYIDNSHYFLASAYSSGTGLTDKVSWIAIGYQNGLTIQWGNKSANTYNISFWFSFSVVCTHFNFVANKDRATSDGWHYYHSLTKSGVSVMSHDETALWIAIGY